MRWKTLEGRELPSWIGCLLAPVFFAVFSPLLLLIFIDRLKRKLIGPTSEWSRWFAWHPVRGDRGFGDSVWLEWVERREWYGQIEHRTMDEANA